MTVACVGVTVGATVVVVAPLTVPVMAPAIVVVVAVPEVDTPTLDVATTGKPGKEISNVKLNALVASKLFDLIVAPVRVLV